MDQIVYNSLLLISTGVIFLRLFGRRSISQMTIAQTVLMISIGTLIVSPIANRNVFHTVIIAAIFVSFIIVLEYIQLKSPLFERLLTGKSLVLIDQGEINIANLKRIRMTVAQLEIRLREKGIGNIQDVKTATLEANGQLGYELKDDVKPITFKEVKQILDDLGLKVDIKNTESGEVFVEARKESNEEKM